MLENTDSGAGVSGANDERRMIVRIGDDQSTLDVGFLLNTFQYTHLVDSMQRQLVLTFPASAGNVVEFVAKPMPVTRAAGLRTYRATSSSSCDPIQKKFFFVVEESLLLLLLLHFSSEDLDVDVEGAKGHARRALTNAIMVDAFL